MVNLSRRSFLRASAGLAASAFAHSALAYLPGNPTGPRAKQDASVQVLHPLGRVPLSFFIDDSTCLVNMGHFCLPQFNEAWPQRDEYKKNWREWPREIPDAFVREFGEFCLAQGVKGKYSVVPFPCCVGWLDRELPGWSRRQLQDSLKLVREVMVPNWDIHPEMITHTRVIDLKTGRPFAQINNGTMENSYPQEKKSVDELAAYLTYALRILKNCELPCEGITTPGGFGNAVKPELSLAVGQAVREVYGSEIPHYFKYVADGKENTQPILEHVEGLDTDAPRVIVNVPAGTGDWFGGWTGDDVSKGHLYSNREGTAGRMVELIERGDPAVMLCHWPGVYSHGSKKGFEDFKGVIAGLSRFRDRTVWMKISEMARYWAAKELTRIERNANQLTLTAPFAAPNFTLQIARATAPQPTLTRNNQPIALKEVADATKLRPGTWLRQQASVTVCFDLPKGQTSLSV